MATKQGDAATGADEPATSADSVIYTWQQFSQHYKLTLNSRQMSYLENVVPIPDLLTISESDLRRTLENLYDVMSSKFTVNILRETPKDKAGAAKWQKDYDEMYELVDAGMQSPLAAGDVDKIMDAVQKLKNEKHLVQPYKQEIEENPKKIIMIGCTSTGKSSFINALLGTSLETKIEGRTTYGMHTFRGNWVSLDGRAWSVLAIDTQGIDDEKEADQAILSALATEYTAKADIHAVLLLMNGQAPTATKGFLEGVKEYHKIFGQVFATNWAVVYSKFYMDARSRKMRAKNHEEQLKNTLYKKLDGSLHIKPARLFFIDSLPDKLGEGWDDSDEMTEGFGCGWQINHMHTVIDDILKWVDTLQPIQTAAFCSKKQEERQHIKFVDQLQEFMRDEYAIRYDEDTGALVLDFEQYKFLQSWMYLRLRGRYYQASHIEIQDINNDEYMQTKFRYLAGRGSKTADGKDKILLKDLFDDIKQFADIYITEMEKVDPSDYSIDSDDNWAKKKLKKLKLSVKCYKK